MSTTQEELDEILGSPRAWLAEAERSAAMYKKWGEGHRRDAARANRSAKHDERLASAYAANAKDIRELIAAVESGDRARERLAHAKMVVSNDAVLQALRSAR